MAEIPNDDSVVKVHISINHENETLSVDFPFSKKFDNIDNVVADLIDTLSIPDIDPNAIKAMIEAQVYKTAPASTGPSFEPITDVFASGNASILSLEDSDSDDDDINDSEYLSLLQQQKKEMQDLNIRQYNEKKALAQRIAAATMNANQFRQMAPSPEKKDNNNNNNNNNCDDLIVF